MGEIFIKVKIVFTALIILVFLGLACVSAEKNQTDVDDLVECSEEILTVDNADVGNFTELKTIFDASENELKLKKDYKYIEGTDTTTIDGFDIGNSNYVVNGQGHTIDAFGHATLFRFSGYNITIKNLRIVNTFAEGIQSHSAL